jgi:hypothetical protein
VLEHAEAVAHHPDPVEAQTMSRSIVRDSSVILSPRTPGRATAQVIDLLGAARGKYLDQFRDKVDQLAELRDLLRRSQEAERELTAEIQQVLTTANVDRLEGAQAVAILGERMTLRPDPELFVQAVGHAAWSALSVSVSAARRLLGADDLQAISETTSSTVLRIEPLSNGKAVA